MEKTKIDWCDSTWNPVTGCRHSCAYCYARNIAERFRPFDFPHLTKDGVFKRINDLHNPVMTECKDGKVRICAYPYGFEPTFHRYRLDEYREKKSRNIFVCSMADLFGDWVPNSWIEEVFAACEAASQHNYIFLTKNPQRYLDLEIVGKLPHKENMWFGITITNKDMAFAWFNSEVKFHWFLSIEPILEDLGELKSDVMPEWIIIGAETGHRKDKVIPKREWIESIVEQCQAESIPVFMKSSLSEIWGKPLMQEFPKLLIRENLNFRENRKEGKQNGMCKL